MHSASRSEGHDNYTRISQFHLLIKQASIFSVSDESPRSSIRCKKEKKEEDKTKRYRSQSTQTPPMHDQQKQPPPAQVEPSAKESNETKRNRESHQHRCLVSVSFPSSNHVTNAPSPKSQKKQLEKKNNDEREKTQLSRNSPPWCPSSSC